MQTMLFYASELAQNKSLPAMLDFEDRRLMGGDFIVDNETGVVKHHHHSVKSSVDRPSVPELVKILETLQGI